MSYDLTFWKQELTATQTPSHIYGELLEGRTVEGLETIETAEFTKLIHQRFPGIVTDGGLTFWEGGERGMFELHTSDQHVHIVCREMSGEDMNVLIEIASTFDCPLYDPQVDKRFDDQVAL
jgi:hypothetical protein